MMSAKRQRLRFVFGVLAASILTLLIPSASAQTIGETIFYQGPFAGPSTQATWTMTPDGSNKTQLGLGLFGTPSRIPHGGHYWFLTTRVIADSHYPNGENRREVFALRDDYVFDTNNNSETVVQISFDPTLQIGGPQWRAGDQSISFMARRWSSVDPGATILAAGIYTAEPAFDASGQIVGFIAPPTAPAISFPIEADGWPRVYGHSWNPAEDKVVYFTSPGLWVADLNGSKTQIFTGDARHTTWSPDGGRIAFTLGRGISTIMPNGKGRKEIIRGTSQWFYGHPHFNPAGTQITCIGGSSASGSTNNEVFVASVNGAGLTNLTLTPAPYIELPIAWR